MRSYIRHPSDIPILIQLASTSNQADQSQLNNVSYGGLAFESRKPFTPGRLVQLNINYVEPAFIAEGIVTHCNEEADHYVVGIEFTDRQDVFVARMVEQICHIEHYKREVARHEGRKLTGQEAAREWIERFAEDFPQWNDENQG